MSGGKPLRFPRSSLNRQFMYELRASGSFQVAAKTLAIRAYCRRRAVGLTLGGRSLTQFRVRGSGTFAGAALRRLLRSSPCDGTCEGVTGLSTRFDEGSVRAWTSFDGKRIPSN